MTGRVLPGAGGGGGGVTSVVGQTGSVTGAEILADASIAAALAGKTSPADVAELKDWVDVKTLYNLAGNTKQLRNVSTTAGSAVISDTAAAWTSADIGKTIRVESTTPVVTTIASVAGPTQCTLATTIATTQTGLYAYYGTDDTAGIQQALNDYGYVSSQAGGKTTLYFSSGCYMIAGALQDTGTWNAQLKVPYQAMTNNPPSSLRLLGDGRTEGYYLGSTTQPPPMAGTIFYSPLQGSGTAPAVIRTAPIGSSYPTANYLHIEIDGMTWRTGNKSNMVVLGLVECNTARVGAIRGVTVDVGVPTGSLAPTTSSYGVAMPDYNNGACSQVGALFINGYGNGIQFAEHFDAKSLSVQSCLKALAIRGAFSGISGAGTHAWHIDRLMTQWCARNFTTTGKVTYGHVDHYDTEHATSGTFTFVNDVDDSGSLMVMIITSFRVVVAGVGAQDSAFAVNGANNVHATPICTGPRFATKTANYTLTNGDVLIYSNGTSLTMTLPAATAAIKGGRVYTIKNLNASSCTVGATAGTIDGAATQTLAQYAVGNYVSDGTNWFTV